MKNLFKMVTLLIMLFTSYGFCENFKNTYLDLLNKNDFVSLEKHLVSWNKANSSDPELYIAYFNYFIYRNYKTAMVSEKSNDGQSVGRLYERQIYNKKDVFSGIEYLDKGLEKFPYRLDMHIGKINMLQQIEEYEASCKQILVVIDLIPKNKGKWQWTDGKLETNFDDNFQNDVQKRVSFLLQQEDKKTLNAAKSVCERMIKAYPGNVWWYNDLASAYFYSSDFKNAIKYFTLGEQVDPNDEFIKFNIAYCSEKANDKATAIKYYKILVNSKDKNTAKRANDRIAELSK